MHWLTRHTLFLFILVLISIPIITIHITMCIITRISILTVFILMFIKLIAGKFGTVDGLEKTNCLSEKKI